MPFGSIPTPSYAIHPIASRGKFSHTFEDRLRESALSAKISVSALIGEAP
jgi:hypothetical protein